MTGRAVSPTASASILPFHPGFGESDPAPHFAGMQDMIVHNLRLVAALGLDRPHLVGHSMGGWMAAEMAAVAGERFARLVLNAPAGLNHPDHPAADLAAISPQELPGYLAHRVDVALRYFPGGSHCPPLEQFLADRGREGEALGPILKVHGMGHPNLGRWLSRIPNETLVVWGEKDRMMPASQAAIWAERIPNARVLIVPDVGHFAMQEEPATVAAIGDFLAGGRAERLVSRNRNRRSFAGTQQISPLTASACSRAGLFDHRRKS